MADVAALNIRIDSADTKKAATDLDKMTASGKKAEGAVSSLTGVAAKLAATLAGLGMASFIKDAAMLAARYETLGVVMIQAGKSAGYGADQMRNFEKSLRAQGISAIEARQNIAKMAAAQMDLAKAGTLARAAQDLAVVGGINSSEAFARMTQGIQSAEVEVLRTIGLNVSWEDSYKRLAKELGKNAASLTVNEKLQARVNETLLKAAAYQGIYEESMKTAGKQISSFSRYWQDMQVDLGNSQLPAVTLLVQSATAKMKEFTEWVKKGETQQALAAIGDTALKAFEVLAKMAATIGPMFMSVLDGWNRLPDVIKEFGLVGALIGGRYGKAIMASVMLFSSLSSSINKITTVASAKLGVPLFDREELNELYKQTQTFEGIQRRLAIVRQEIASGAGVSIYQDENDKYLKKLKAQELELVNALADSPELKLLQAKEDDMRAAQARIYAQVSGVKTTEVAAKTEAELNKIRNASESLRVELEKANDVNGEGAGVVAAMEKKYAAYAKTLGASNPLVREYGKLIEYVNAHHGKTPEQVAKAEQAITEHVAELNKEIDALKSIEGLYGAGSEDKITLIHAQTKAQEEYNKAIKNGVAEEKAAELQRTEIALATAKMKRKHAEDIYNIDKEFSDRTTANQQSAMGEYMSDSKKKIAAEQLWFNKQKESYVKAGGTVEEFYSKHSGYMENVIKENDETTAMFRKLWENAIDRIDGAFANMWKDFITGSKSAMESLKSMFQNTLAEIAHAAITKPIVVQMSGMFTGSSLFSSTAYAGGGGIFSGGGTSGGTTGAGGVATGGASGSGMNVGSLVSPSWFTPSSWAASANSWAAEAMPSIFGTGASAYGAGMTAGTTAYGSAFGSAYSSALATGATTGAAVAEATAAAEAASTAATAAANGAQSTLTGTLGAAGMAGGLGYLAGSAFQAMGVGNSSTPSLTGAGAAIGSIWGPVGSVVGGAVGGLASLVVGGGGKGPRTASNYTQVQSTWGGDWEESASAYAWGSRGADTQSEFATAMYKWIGDTGKAQRAEIQAIIDVTDNAAAVNKALDSTQVAFGHGQRGRDGHSIYEWNKNSDMEANMKAIAEEMSEVLWEGVMNASKDLDWSSEDFKTDFSTVEGTQTTYATIAALDAINDAIGEIKEPTDGLTTAIKAVDTQFDAYKDTLEALGYGVKTLTQLEADRADVLAKVRAEYTKAFDNDMALRGLALGGDAVAYQTEQLRQKQEAELTAAISQFGAASTQYAALLAMQARETEAYNQAVIDAAKQSYATQAASVSATLKEKATALETAASTARSEYIAGLEEEASRLSDVSSALKSFGSALKKLKTDLYLDKNISTLGVSDRYGLAGSELTSLYTKAMNGDQEAMAKLQDTSKTYLETSKEYNADFGAYRRDFDRVQDILSDVENSAYAQASIADAQLTSTNGVIDALGGSTGSIVSKLEELRLAYLSAVASESTALKAVNPETAYLAANADVAAAVKAGQFSSGLQHYTLYGQYESRGAGGYSSLTQEGMYLNNNPDVAAAVRAGQFTSAAQHYLLFGQYEGRAYASGGYASPGYAMVGEEGPELVQFKNPARVYTASQTRAALSGGSDGADLAGEIRALKDDLRAALAVVARNTRITADTQRKWDTEGTPVNRTYV